MSIHAVDVTNRHDWQPTDRNVTRWDGVRVICKCARCGLEYERSGLLAYPLWWARLDVKCEVKE